MDRKRKPSEKKSSCFHSTFANKKFPWLAFLAIAMILRLVQKRFSRPCEKKGWDTAGFSRKERAVFFSLFTSKTLCRLHLIVLVDLIMFTHINNAHINNTFAISLSHASLKRHFTFTVPMLDVSFSCIMLCHPRRYRYVKCTEARRPSPCRATWRSGTCSCCRCK